MLRSQRSGMLKHDQKKEQSTRISSGSNGLNKSVVKSKSGSESRRDAIPSRASNLSTLNRSKVNASTPPATSKPVAVKKFKFNELMKKASKVDQTKLSININSRSKSPETSSTQNKSLLNQKTNKQEPRSSPLNSCNNSNQMKSHNGLNTNNIKSSNVQKQKIDIEQHRSRNQSVASNKIKSVNNVKSLHHSIATGNHKSPVPQKNATIAKREIRNSPATVPSSLRGKHKTTVRPSKLVKSKVMESEPKTKKASIPFRGPSAKLQENLKNRNKLLNNKRPLNSSKDSKYAEDEDDDDDMRSFIASDEEDVDERSSLGYNRDEIWAIFNKGKKRNYNDYSDSDSDMEATGADILDEENRSRRNAEMEDKRELEEEKRLAAIKRSRRAK